MAHCKEEDGDPISYGLHLLPLFCQPSYLVAHSCLEIIRKCLRALHCCEYSFTGSICGVAYIMSRATGLQRERDISWSRNCFCSSWSKPWIAKGKLPTGSHYTTQPLPRAQRSRADQMWDWLGHFWSTSWQLCCWLQEYVIIPQPRSGRGMLFPPRHCEHVKIMLS